MINKLDMTVEHQYGKTCLKDTYFTRPFRIANIGEDRSDPALYLMIMSSSPGILDKDFHDIRITVKPHGRLLLQTQSYQRLFRMDEGAGQRMVIDLHENSRLSYIQHPVVPHEHSIFESHSTVLLADNAVFTFGEIITCGRKHSGELFRFTRFGNLTEVYHNDNLLLKDNILLEPALCNMYTLGQTEGYTHQATLLHIDTGTTTDASGTADCMRAALEAEEDIVFGISQPAPSCTVVRVLGNGGEQIFEAFKRIERCLWKDSPNQDVLSD